MRDAPKATYTIQSDSGNPPGEKSMPLEEYHDCGGENKKSPAKTTAGLRVLGGGLEGVMQIRSYVPEQMSDPFAGWYIGQHR